MADGLPRKSVLILHCIILGTFDEIFTMMCVKLVIIDFYNPWLAALCFYGAVVND